MKVGPSIFTPQARRGYVCPICNETTKKTHVYACLHMVCLNCCEPIDLCPICRTHSVTHFRPNTNETSNIFTRTKKWFEDHGEKVFALGIVIGFGYLFHKVASKYDISMSASDQALFSAILIPPTNG